MVVLLTTASLEGQHLAKSFFNTGLLGAAGSSGPSDDQFNRVSFLSHFEGSNNGVNNAFDDGSASNHTITANGNVTQGSFNPFGTNWSHEFLPDTGNAAIVGGTGDRDSVNNDATRISVPASASNFAWGNPFTIEFFCFLRKLSTSNAGGFSYDLDNNFMLNQVNGNALESNGGPPDSAFSIVERAGNLVINVYYDPAGDGSQASVTNAASHASNTTSTGDDFAVNTWHHVAMTWDGSNYYGYVDGVRKATINSSTAPHRSDEPIRIGGLRSGNSNEYGNMDGFISNVRIVIGTNLYPNNNFTPPTSQLTAVTNTKLLTCHANRMLDGSSIGGTVTSDPQDTGMNGAALQGKVSKFGPFLTSSVYDAAVNGASGYFDGSDDLTIPTSSDFNLSNNPFTFSFWANFSAAGTLYGRYYYPSNQREIFIGIETDGTIRMRISPNGNSYSDHATASGVFVFNQWNYIVITRTISGSDSVFKTYVNGTLSKTTTINITTINHASQATYIMNYGAAVADRPTGYLCDFKLVNGTATVADSSNPTAPATNTTNTKLLLNMADAQAIDSAAQSNLTLYGNAKLSTGQAKFGNTSMVLDGTGDFAQVQGFEDLAGPFTIECFARADDTDNAFLWCVGTYTIELGISGNDLRIYASGGYTNFFTGGEFTANNWHHVALVRDTSNVIKVYLNGTASSTTLTASTTYAAGDRLFIGGEYASATSINHGWDGYIDEFRVSQFARYTSNFTAPTKAFEDKGQ